MADTISINEMFAEYTSAHFVNNCKAFYCAMQPFEKDFDAEYNGYNVGDTLKYRKANYFNTRQGEVASPKDLVENFGTISLNHIDGADWLPSNLDLTLDMDKNEQIAERFTRPAGIKIANGVDLNILNEMELKAAHVYDATSGGFGSFATFNLAQAQLDKFGVVGRKKCIGNIDDMAALRNDVSNYFNTQINEEVGIRGILGELSGVQVFLDQNISTHTNGTFPTGSNVTVKTTMTSGTNTVVLENFTAGQTGVLKAGDVITFANVFAVNPVSLNVTGAGAVNLATFTVQSTQDSDGGGEATITLDRNVVFESGNAYNNVDRLPTASDVVTLIGGASAVVTNNYIFVEDAIMLAIKPLRLPNGLPQTAVGRFIDEETGLSMRALDTYDGINNKELKRLDVLYGYEIQGDYMIRVLG